MAERNAKPEMLMPVTDDHALQQFQIEALQRINDNLRLLNNGQTETVKALGEMRESLHGIDIRLVRIESKSVSKEVEALKAKVDDLESDRDKRVGAVNLGNWIFRNWPGVLGFVAMVVLMLQVTGKVKL